MQAELVDRARRGDREAFGVLAAGAVDRLYAIARLVLRDTELAEDATQEALVRAWRDLPTLRDVERFDAWLYRLIVRASADIGRHRRRWRAEITMLSKEPSEPDRTSALADRDQLERGMRRLTVAQQTILVLHFYVGLTPSRDGRCTRDPRRDRQVPAPLRHRGAPRGHRGRRARPRSAPCGRAERHERQRQPRTPARRLLRSPRPRREHPTGCCGRPSQTIDDTPQRRVLIRVPWRFPHMNNFAKVAIAAVVVIAVGALGLSVLRPSSSSNVGGQPTASPSPSPSPSFSPSPSSPSPSASVVSPAALTETFTSERHGFSISYPAGWVPRPATVAVDDGHPRLRLDDAATSSTTRSWTAASGSWLPRSRWPARPRAVGRRRGGRARLGGFL